MGDLLARKQELKIKQISLRPAGSPRSTYEKAAGLADALMEGNKNG